MYNQILTPKLLTSEYNNNLCYAAEVDLENIYYGNYKFGNILEKIIYPSGGAIGYEYEYHEFLKITIRRNTWIYYQEIM